MELTLRFRLEHTEEPIEVVGSVAWLDPTQKEAGISFTNLSSDAERRIADWIATQEQAISVAQHDVSPQPKSPSMRGAEAPLSMRPVVPASLAGERSENAQPRLSGRIPRRVLSESSLDDLSTTPPGLQWTTSSPPALDFPTPEERFERPSDKLLRSPAKRYEALLEPEQPAMTAKEIPPKDSPWPGLTPSPAKVTEANRPAARADDSLASKLRRRQKFAMAGAACAAGILGLVVTITSIRKPSGRRGPAGESAGVTSSVVPVKPESAPQIPSKALNDQSAQSDTSADDPTNTESDYDLLPILPTNQPATVSQDGDWAAHVESMLGMDPPAKINPAVLGLPVWTVQHSGFYYCGDNLNSETPQPGNLMTQGEALQSGYQPKLGSYCN